MENLKKRWGITSNFQLVIIFVVFAITGSASALWFTPVRLIVIFPLYPFVLMFFGYLFGQSKFFFPFSKKMLRSMGLGFVFKEEKK
jgi:uncharacterized membrane protein YoaK (UPF0700 family)